MTFRGNNERDRFLMMKREGAYEDMSIDDFEYANLSIYMLILLRTPSFGGVMLNVNYMPPKAHERQVRSHAYNRYVDLKFMSFSCNIRLSTFVQSTIF